MGLFYLGLDSGKSGKGQSSLLIPKAWAQSLGLPIDEKF